MNKNNFGKPWSKQEIEELLGEIEDEITIPNIAKSHERTIGAIKSKLGSIAVNMYFNKYLIEEISVTTGLSEDEIIKEIKRKTGKKKQMKTDSASLEKEMDRVAENIKSLNFKHRKLQKLLNEARLKEGLIVKKVNPLDG